MTTAEIITKLRDMEAQCIDAPKSKQFFSDTRERLESMTSIKENAESILLGTSDGHTLVHAAAHWNDSYNTTEAVVAVIMVRENAQKIIDLIK